MFVVGACGVQKCAFLRKIRSRSSHFVLNIVILEVRKPYDHRE